MVADDVSSTAIAATASRYDANTNINDAMDLKTDINQMISDFFYFILSVFHHQILGIDSGAAARFLFQTRAYSRKGDGRCAGSLGVDLVAFEVFYGDRGCA